MHVLKKAECLEALGDVIRSACLLRQRRQSGQAIPSPPGDLTRPTGHNMVRHLESVQAVHDPDGTRHVAFDPICHATHPAVRAAAGMEATVLTPSPVDLNTD